MKPLVVRPPWATQAAWTGLWKGEDGAGATPAPLRWERLEDLPPCKELILVLPAAALSWHRVSLPRLPAHRWRAALAGLLEERLLADAEDVHLALAPDTRAGQDVLVAACDRRWLTQLLQALEMAGRPAARIVPEFEPGPRRIHLLGLPEQGWMVECRADGVSCLPLAHPARDTLLAWRGLMGADAEVSAEPALTALAEEAWQRPPRLVPAGHQLLAAAASAWELAQFGLAPHHGWFKHLHRQMGAWLGAPAWRAARWGVSALLLLHLAGLQAWAWKEERQLRAQQEELQAVLTRTFPHVKLVIDPMRQMERETNQLARSTGQALAGDLSPMLAALSSLGAPVPGEGSLDFRPGELRLAGWTFAPERLAEAQALLARQGYQLEEQDSRWLLRSATRQESP